MACHILHRFPAGQSILCAAGLCLRETSVFLLRARLLETCSLEVVVLRHAFLLVEAEETAFGFFRGSDLRCIC